MTPAGRHLRILNLPIAGSTTKYLLVTPYVLVILHDSKKKRRKKKELQLSSEICRGSLWDFKQRHNSEKVVGKEVVLHVPWSNVVMSCWGMERSVVVKEKERKLERS